MKKTLFMSAWDMDVEKGGVNKVMLRRSYLLKNKKYQPVLLTMDYKPNYKEIQNELRATGQLHLDVKILNIFDYYREKFATDVISEVERQHFEKSRQKFEDDYWVEDAGDHARYFFNGRYVKYKRWNEDGSLRVVDYFDENRVRISREEFHIAGYKIKETLFHPANNKKNQERYFTPNGFCFITFWFNYTTGALQRIFLFDPKFSKALDFKNRQEFQSYWLTELCRLEAVKPIIIVDGAVTADRVAAVDDELVDKVFVLHGNHLVAPYTKGSGFRKAIQPIIDAIPKGYATVVLTDAQRQDLHSEVGNRGNIHVIPNTVYSNEPQVDKNPFQLAMVCRLVPAKRVEHAIKAIHSLIEDIPEIQLTIYGIGDEEENLQKLIADCQLEAAVKLMGYTNKTDEIYRSSAALVMTSEAEGLSLCMQESFLNGTPVISYDINYGPAQYIVNDVNGYLVENGQIDALAEAMKKIILDPQHASKLGAAAQKLAEEQFDEQTYIKRWEDVLNFAASKGPKLTII
ncbi:glycosyltransferase [Kurthia sibirica]|uniref:Glycosyl transferase family 1 domain-containing protein n=1 Tax=Kurthia sibirica TaxID=202750 RepID=A0A2U3AL03_9BACL|nr:glycosyltransferase [Kurthia sibirica]PWI25213.1 hypothetical protein DEX24_09770 [Kurthia sibirica]GEK35197.1 glycosyl transferase family 1 [Kurthia sibirica]